MTHQIQFGQWVPVPIDRVFLFFADPQNLPRIMPPETGTEVNHLRLVTPPGFPQIPQLTLTVPLWLEPVLRS